MSNYDRFLRSGLSVSTLEGFKVYCEIMKGDYPTKRIRSSSCGSMSDKREALIREGIIPLNYDGDIDKFFKIL